MADSSKHTPRSLFVCVDDEHATHRTSSTSNVNGNLWYFAQIMVGGNSVTPPSESARERERERTLMVVLAGSVLLWMQIGTAHTHQWPFFLSGKQLQRLVK